MAALFQLMSDCILYAACLFILGGCLYLSFKTRFVQLRFLPTLLKMLKTSLSKKAEQEGAHTILPHRALLTAMSTTLGISTIVGPVIAIRLGGPGALFGFLLTAFFGAAATYVEVNLAVTHRRRLESGVIMGGPMQYLQRIFSPFMAKWYAAGCLTLMAFWSGAQSNQLAAILNSPLLGSFSVPKIVSGALIAVLILVTLMGGIKRIGALSAKLVPLMFALYIGSCLWIVCLNVDRLPQVFSTMFSSAFSPYAMASGALVGGLMSGLRWGIFKGMHSSEAGIGTQAIPHSMAETKDPEAQGALAMLSTYTAGAVAFLSGCVALLTQTWESDSLPLGINMVAASFNLYLSYFGLIVILISVMLFGFGTILGNCYNGSQCYSYLSNNRKTRLYLIGTTLMVFLGAIADVRVFWSHADLILAAVAVPHMAALVYYSYSKKPIECETS